MAINLARGWKKTRDSLIQFDPGWWCSFSEGLAMPNGINQMQTEPTASKVVNLAIFHYSITQAVGCDRANS
jgi:hypothetical protein